MSRRRDAANVLSCKLGRAPLFTTLDNAGMVVARLPHLPDCIVTCDVDVDVAFLPFPETFHFSPSYPTSRFNPLLFSDSAA